MTSEPCSMALIARIALIARMVPKYRDDSYALFYGPHCPYCPNCPPGPPCRYRPETCCVIGNYYSLKAEHEKAVTYFRRALKLNRHFLSAWTLMGHEYVELKNTAAAVDAYRHAVDINPKDYRAWYGASESALSSLLPMAILSSNDPHYPNYILSSNDPHDPHVPIDPHYPKSFE